MVGPAWARRITAACIVVLVLVTGCSWLGSGDGDGDSDGKDTPYLVSYSGAADQLAALDEFEATEQLRDWARLGLARSLGLNRDQMVDALYDTTPIRDSAFAELVEQPTGPGRGLFDGNTLHILVPQDDPHRSRTIGLILDQHRADSGADSAQAQVHRYRILPERRLIELFAEPAAPTSTIRTDNGWHEVRVDQPNGVAYFLSVTNHLSRMETRGKEIWAAGWRWPKTPGAQVTAADVTVLQRGYQQASGPRPGFSLDPKTVSTVADVRATIPELAPALTESVISGNWAGSGYSSAGELLKLVNDTLFQQQPSADTPHPGLPTDRTQLWALSNLLRDEPVFSQARYEGGLAGTEVGMSLFYADLVAKDWITGVGQGVPSRAVPGFVPDPQVTIPSSLCPTEPRGESGRLWFGQSGNAFSFSQTGVSIGAQATRLFSRSNGSDGTEVEPSYGFGHGLRWWDVHYREIADYEPAYDRLEQIMRWSGALEWLTTTTQGELPPVGEIRDGLRFADWYAEHGELRERTPLTLTTPPSAGGKEAVLPTPSATTPNCGFLRVVGGVSLAEGLARGGDLPSGTTALPPGIRRAGPVDPSTNSVDPTTHSGRFERVTPGKPGQITDRLTFDLQREQDSTSVQIVGSHRDSIPYGEAPLRDGTSQREFHTEVRSDGPNSDGPNYVFDLTYETSSIGSLSVRKPPSSGARQIDISEQPGQLPHLRDAVKRVSTDPAHGLDDAPGLQYHYPGPDGQTLYRFDAGWIEVGTGFTSSRIIAASNVMTPNGVVQVRVVTPARLSEVDVASLRIVEEGTARAGDISNRVSPDVPIMMDTALLVAGHPGALPAPIAAGALVKFHVVRTTSETTPGPFSQQKRTWSRVDHAAFPRGSDSTSAGGKGGGQGGGGGDAGKIALVIGEIVLITVCPQDEDDEDCG